ncbi:MAG TPA: hypothetical protein VE823_19745 [Geodermatophilus sp.]|jgi:hypothetical protein|nr:hypothetical protein [Geodermatophilus sp.]
MTRNDVHGTTTPEQTSPARPTAGEGEHRVEIRLPFLTITRGGTAARSGPPGTQTTGDAGTRAGLEKLAFYGGAAALAAFGVIDWPVAALVAAGTYIAQRSRGSSANRPQPGREGPSGADEEPAGAAERHRTSPRRSRS